MASKIGSLARSPLTVVTAVAGALLIGNLFVTPAMLSPAHLPNLTNLLVPSLLVAMASVPSIMSGRGGLDLSVGPLLGFVNVVLVGVLLPHALGGVIVAIPILLLVGASVGLLLGITVAFGRIQPVVVTLGGYLVLSGWSLVLMPQPKGGVPVWVHWLSGAWLGGLFPRTLLLLGVAAAIWMTLRRAGVIATILAIGSDDRAAYTSGINIARIRCLAYVVGGIFAALAGIALSVLIQSGDPTVGHQYTLPAIAAVALGGNQLQGGRGTMSGPVLGAVSLFLIQTLLSALQVNSLWIQIVYGVVLLAALVTNTTLAGRLTFRYAESSAT
ncbi:MAG: ribose transport system permease protein [Actinomycetota bacterium]|jgi:ribose transport system permease protein|nr:ribose transport system permease protein [Actinomycetota bacterium]